MATRVQICLWCNFAVLYASTMISIVATKQKPVDSGSPFIHKSWSQQQVTFIRGCAPRRERSLPFYLFVWCGARRSAPKANTRGIPLSIEKTRKQLPKRLYQYGEPRRFEERMVAPRIMLIMRCWDNMEVVASRRRRADTANNLRCPASLFGCALNPNGAQSKQCDSLAHRFCFSPQRTGIERCDIAQSLSLCRRRFFCGAGAQNQQSVQCSFCKRALLIAFCAAIGTRACTLPVSGLALLAVKFATRSRWSFF